MLSAENPGADRVPPYSETGSLAKDQLWMHVPKLVLLPLEVERCIKMGPI